MLPYLFIITTLLSFVLFYLGTGKDKRVLIISSLWLFTIALIAYNGYFENTIQRPPRFLFVILATTIISVIIYRKTRFNEISVNFLMGVHALRTSVEFILFELFLRHKIPILMTYKGWNFDILIGISALLILFYLLYTKKNLSGAFLLSWNILGVTFLSIIVLIAIFSSPSPIQQLAFEQPNIAVLQFPYIFLPTYIVPVVFISHLLTIRDTLNG